MGQPDVRPSAGFRELDADERDGVVALPVRQPRELEQAWTVDGAVFAGDGER